MLRGSSHHRPGQTIWSSASTYHQQAQQSRHGEQAAQPQVWLQQMLLIKRQQPTQVCQSFKAHHSRQEALCRQLQLSLRAVSSLAALILAPLVKVVQKVHQDVMQKSLQATHPGGALVRLRVVSRVAQNPQAQALRGPVAGRRA